MTDPFCLVLLQKDPPLPPTPSASHQSPNAPRLTKPQQRAVTHRLEMNGILPGWKTSKTTGLMTKGGQFKEKPHYSTNKCQNIGCIQLKCVNFTSIFHLLGTAASLLDIRHTFFLLVLLFLNFLTLNIVL